MEELKLDVQVRKETGTRKVRGMRRNNVIPAVVYGGKEKTTPIQVSRKDFERIERTHRSESVIFRLNILDGDKKLKDYSAIVKEVQHHPVSDLTLHIDFNRISLTKEIEVKVPIVAKGEAIGVKQDGGSLDHVLWELEVICLPTKIPHNIEVDISPLKIHDTIHVKDLRLPEGVKTKHDPESIVFTVAPPMKEVPVEEVAPEAAVTEPEVIKEKKEKEEAKPASAEQEKPKAEAKEKAKEKERK